MIKRPDTRGQRIKRHDRVRGKISGTAERPRLCVFRSESNIYAQIIDDVAGVTLVAASTVEKGFEKKLEINGVGYRAAKEGKDLVLTLGYSHPVVVSETADIQIEVPDANHIVIKGIDKQKVGQFAADIRGKRPPEPYKGKGVKYDFETIRRKEGKTGAK